MREDIRTPIVVGLALLIVQLPVLGAGSPLGKVVPRLGDNHLNGEALALETTVFSGDLVSTEAQSLAVVQLRQGDQVHVGPASAVSLQGEDAQLAVGLKEGMTIIRSGQGQEIAVNALGLTIRPDGAAAYTVAIHEGAVYVASEEGSLEVMGSNRSVAVPSGKAMKFELASTTAAGKVGAGASSMTPGQAAVITLAISLGVSLGIVWPVLNNQIDDAEDLAREEARQACIDAIRSISSAASTAACG